MTDVKLGTSSHKVETRTGAGVTATLGKAFLITVHKAMAVTPAPVQVPILWPLVPSFTWVVG